MALLEVYSDGAILANSGTNSPKFCLFRFSNLQEYSKDWLKVAISSCTKRITASLHVDKRRKMKVNLLQRFLLLLFKNTIRASYSGFVVNGAMLFTRMGMVALDQPEERDLLCLKGRDSYIECSACTLPSLKPVQVNRRENFEGRLTVERYPEDNPMIITINVTRILRIYLSQLSYNV